VVSPIKLKSSPCNPLLRSSSSRSVPKRCTIPANNLHKMANRCEIGRMIHKP
jgi:hypothetical protein